MTRGEPRHQDGWKHEAQRDKCAAMCGPEWLNHNCAIIGADSFPREARRFLASIGIKTSARMPRHRAELKPGNQCPTLAFLNPVFEFPTTRTEPQTPIPRQRIQLACRQTPWPGSQASLP